LYFVWISGGTQKNGKAGWNEPGLTFIIVSEIYNLWLLMIMNLQTQLLFPRLRPFPNRIKLFDDCQFFFTLKLNWCFAFWIFRYDHHLISFAICRGPVPLLLQRPSRWKQRSSLQMACHLEARNRRPRSAGCTLIFILSSCG